MHGSGWVAYFIASWRSYLLLFGLFLGEVPFFPLHGSHKAYIEQLLHEFPLSFPQQKVSIRVRIRGRAGAI